MLYLARSLAAPLFSLFFLILGSGLLNTFVSVRMEIEGYRIETIGGVVASLYIGILLGSLWLDRLVGRVGHIRSFALFAIVSTLLVLAQALWINPIYWGVLRLICGICTAGVFIVIESWLLMQSPPGMRSAALSLYLVLFYTALSGGQFLINLSNPDSMFPFFLTAVLFAISILPISFRKIAEPTIENTEKLTLPQLFRTSPLGFLGGIISGMLLAAVYGLVPVYAKEIGMGVSEIGTLMGIIILGGLMFQWPMGQWADRTDRRRVLSTASFMAAFFAISIAVSTPSFGLFLILGWFFGGFSFTIYPISMAFTCEKSTDNQIVAVTGGFVLSYGLGAIAGPLAAPLAMSLFGNGGLFYFLALITCFLGVISLKRPLDEIA